MVQNKGLIYKSPPVDWPIEGQDLAIESREFDLDTEPPKDGITTKNYYVSFDPYQRTRMRGPGTKYYSAPYELGKSITNSAVAKVLKSNNAKFQEGNIVTGRLSTEEYSVISGDEITQDTVKKLDNPYNLDPKLYLGALGMTGLTAYSSFYDIGLPKKGETIFISAASGAVGQMVGQLAKHEGLTVIGSVGSDKKLDFIKKDLDFDEGFNYKKEKPSTALKRLAPNGIDIYYENVGGEHLDAALEAMRDYGRISECRFPTSRQRLVSEAKGFAVMCGMVSQYNITDPKKKYGVMELNSVVGKRLTLRGFIVSDSNMGPKYAQAHQENVAKWISEGKFKAQQSVTVGIDNGVKGLLGMLRGDNFGKAVLQIEELKV